MLSMTPLGGGLSDADKGGGLPRQLGGIGGSLLRRGPRLEAARLARTSGLENQ